MDATTVTTREERRMRSAACPEAVETFGLDVERQARRKPVPPRDLFRRLRERLGSPVLVPHSAV